MKFLLVHPGATVSTHDVFMGLMEGLRGGGHEVSVYPLDVKLSAAAHFLNTQRNVERETLGIEMPNPNDAEIQLQACEGLVIRAKLSRVDWVLVVSGMFVPLAVIQALRLCGVRVGLVLTESPYDEEFEAKWAANADAVFSNERLTAKKLGAHYLPHAWRRDFHDAPLQTLPAMPAHECVFVGTGFSERVEWFTRFVHAGGPLALYGTWPVPDGHPLVDHIVGDRTDGFVSNQHAVALYAKAGTTLNLYRTSRGATGFSEQADHITAAESLNPRAYELAARGVPHVSTPRAEVEEVFGALVPQVDSPEAAAAEINRLLALTPGQRSALSFELQKRVRGHTWDVRAQEIVRVLSA